MSIQWTIIAGFLYFEMVVVIILISPIFGPKYYNFFYHCRLFTTFKKHIRIYFLILLGILCLFLRDSCKEILNYSHISTDWKDSIKLIRAQRNFCITGLSILFAFVIRRLIIMFRNHYKLQMKAEAITKKAENTMKLVKTRLSKTNQYLEEHKLKELKKGATTRGQENEGEVVGLTETNLKHKLVLNETVHTKTQ